MLTHPQLVMRCQTWLRNSMRHPVSLTEIGSAGAECPDVIGWMHSGTCTLIECKTSRADYRRDAKKSFRRGLMKGLGHFRYYAIPAGMPGGLPLEELPEGWGLIMAGKSQMNMLRRATRFDLTNTSGETAILLSALRRATEGWGRKVFGEISPVHGLCDPHPTVRENLKAYRTEIASLRAKLRRREDVIHKLDGGKYIPDVET